MNAGEEQQQELIPITLWLAGRSYRIKIKPNEEEGVRRAVKVAEQRLMDLHQNFSGKDEQDYITMLLLMYATDQVTEPEGLNAIQDDIVKEMIGDINNAL